jgi:hypothetical protein
VERRKRQVKRQKAKERRKRERTATKGRGKAAVVPPSPTVETCRCVVTKPPRHLPPPDSELWPPYCRGKLWDWGIARFFVGRCQLCAYSCPPTPQRRRLDKLSGLPTFLICTNHPDSPGQLQEVIPTWMCRNFKAKSWKRPRVRPGPGHTSPSFDPSDPTLRRIALGQDLFATVDAADYRRINKHKWYAYRHGRQIYAICRTHGKTVYMHRMVLRARPGTLVDHTDGNGLNNRRCNLRICNAAQNRANARSSGGAWGMSACTPKATNGGRRSPAAACSTISASSTTRSPPPTPATARPTR